MINGKKSVIAPRMIQPLSKSAKARLRVIAKMLEGRELFPESVSKAKKVLEKVRFSPK